MRTVIRFVCLCISVAILGFAVGVSSAHAQATTYKVVVPKPGFKFRNNLGQQLTLSEVKEQLPDGTWNIHSTMTIWDGDSKIAEHTSPNMTIDSPRAFSTRGATGLRLLYRATETGTEFIQSRSFRFVDGEFDDFHLAVAGQFPTHSTESHAINDRGDVAGYAISKAYMYTNSSVVDVGRQFVGLNNAFGINNHGMVTGWSIETGLWYSILYRPATAGAPMSAIKLPLLNPAYARGGGADVNDAGDVVGSSAVTDTANHAYLYRNGVMTDLGTLGGPSSFASSISETGVIVGGATNAAGEDRAMVYRDGEMFDLNDLVDPADPLAGAGFTRAANINEDGVITVASGPPVLNQPYYLLVPTGGDTAYYNFESGQQDWHSNGEAILALSTTPAQQFAGDNSLGIQVHHSGFASIRVTSPPVLPGKTITFHIFIPADAQIEWVQPFAQQGEAGGWNWHGNWKPIEAFQLGAWNTIAVGVPTDAQPLNAIGLEFYATAPFAGTVYLDSVGS